MRSPEIKSYAAAYELGKPIQAYTIGEVLRSEHKDVKVGQHLYGFSTCAEYVVVDAASVARLRLIENKEGLPWTTLVGAAGMSGECFPCRVSLSFIPDDGSFLVRSNRLLVILQHW